MFDNSDSSTTSDTASDLANELGMRSPPHWSARTNSPTRLARTNSFGANELSWPRRTNPAQSSAQTNSPPRVARTNSVGRAERTRRSPLRERTRRLALRERTQVVAPNELGLVPSANELTALFGANELGSLRRPNPAQSAARTNSERACSEWPKSNDLDHRKSGGAEDLVPNTRRLSNALSRVSGTVFHGIDHRAASIAASSDDL
jgi:hypothetical protein